MPRLLANIASFPALSAVVWLALVLFSSVLSTSNELHSFFVENIDSNHHSTSCQSHDACHSVLQDYIVSVIQQYRCQHVDNITFPSQRLLAFTHIPKCGGSSVVTILSDSVYIGQHPRQPRFIIPALFTHETYGSEDFETGHNRLFSVLLRNPVSRAISLFNYMKGHSSDTNRDVPIWAYTTQPKVTLDKWVKQPGVIKFLKQDMVSWLGTVPFASVDESKQAREKRLKNSLARNNSLQALMYSEAVARTVLQPNKSFPPPIDSDSSFPVSEEQLVDDVKRLVPDERYQCMPQMKAVLLLIRRYSAVGTLEDMRTFWTVLSARAGLKMPLEAISTAAGINTNPSKAQPIRKEFVDVIKSTLAQELTCDVFLWKMAQKIADHDRSRCSVVISSIATAEREVQLALEREAARLEAERAFTLKIAELKEEKRLVEQQERVNAEKKAAARLADEKRRQRLQYKARKRAAAMTTSM